MNPEPSTALEQLQKSIQTFEELALGAVHRDNLWRYSDAFMQSLRSILEDTDCSNEDKLKYFNTTLEQYTDAMKNLFDNIISQDTLIKSDDQFDEIVEVEKFNPYHDELGRFSTADHYDQFTINTRDPNKQHLADAAIAREKDREARGLVFGPKIKPKADGPKEPPKPTLEPYIPVPKATSTKTNIPEKVLTACQGVEAKSVKLQNEKLTLVNENGEVVHEKRGGKASVSIDDYTKAMMGENVTLTHNHPGEFGGTFSGADVNVLTKYNLRAIRAVGVEGTYSLERKSNTTGLKASYFNQAYKTLADDVDTSLRAQHKLMRAKVNGGTMTVEDANRHLANHRNKECDRMHDWLVQNAAKYDYNYVFTPSSGGVNKMYDIEKEEVEEETSGEITLDGEFISGDNWMIKDDESDD